MLLFIVSNVAIYIDYDNIYIMLEKYYEKGTDDLRVEIISKIKKKFETDKIITFKAFADFSRINNIINRFQKSQIELRHIYSSKEGRKNASDIALTIDVIKSLYVKSNIEKYVIVSSDSDMLPIINELRFHGKEVFVIYSDLNSVNNYDEYLDEKEYEKIETLLGVDKYVCISESVIKNKIQSYLNSINNLINNQYDKHTKRDKNNKVVTEGTTRAGL